MKSMPDYKNYSLEELVDVYQHINKKQYPERFKAVCEEIKKRKREDDHFESNWALNKYISKNAHTYTDYIDRGHYFGFRNRLKIKKDEEILTLTKSKISHLIQLLGSLVFLSLYYFALLNDWGFSISEIFSNLEIKEKIFRLIFLVFPLFFLEKILRISSIAVEGEEFIFSKPDNSFLLNNRKLEDLSDIENVQIRVISDVDSSDEYILSVISKKGKKYLVEESWRKREVYKAAEFIADFLEIGVTKSR